jgi:hypothetical protein
MSNDSQDTSAANWVKPVVFFEVIAPEGANQDHLKEFLRLNQLQVGDTCRVTEVRPHVPDKPDPNGREINAVLVKHKDGPPDEEAMLKNPKIGEQKQEFTFTSESPEARALFRIVISKFGEVIGATQPLLQIGT